MTDSITPAKKIGRPVIRTDEERRQTRTRAAVRYNKKCAERIKFLNQLKELIPDIERTQLDRLTDPKIQALIALIE